MGAPQICPVWDAGILHKGDPGQADRERTSGLCSSHLAASLPFSAALSCRVGVWEP